MNENNCYYVCGSDTHGTPIMLKARSEGVKPERLVSDMSKSHLADFMDFGIQFDNYHSTHHPINQELVEDIYKKLQEKGLIQEKRNFFAYHGIHTYPKKLSRQPASSK